MTDSRIDASAMDSPITPVYNQFAATVVRSRLAREDRLDPRITEIVRLRCARIHDCRVCQSMREVTARQAGLDEDLAAQIDHYEVSDFPESWKVALRLTDAVVLIPGSVDDQLDRDVHRHFTDAQITELLFDIMKWSWQKALVALRLEAPIDGVRDVRFGADGEAILGADALLAVE